MTSTAPGFRACTEEKYSPGNLILMKMATQIFKMTIHNTKFYLSMYSLKSIIVVCASAMLLAGALSSCSYDDDIRETNDNVEVLQNDIATIQATVSSLTKQLSDARSEAASAQEQLDEAIKRLQSLEASYASKEYVDALNAKMAAEAKAEAAEAKAKAIQEAKDYADALLKKAQEYTDESVSELEQEIKALQAMVERLNTLYYTEKALKSVSLVPEYYDSQAPSGYVICYHNVQGPHFGTGEATWKINPDGANLKDAKFQIVNRSVISRAADPDASNLISDCTFEVNEDTTRIVSKFTVNTSNVSASGSSLDLIALRITVPASDGNGYITVQSDYYVLKGADLYPVVPVTGISFENTSIITNTNVKTEQLTVTVLPENATNKEVVWSSNKPNVASVDENGLVTIHKAGCVTITATTKDGGFSATCYIVIFEISIGDWGVGGLEPID